MAVISHLRCVQGLGLSGVSESLRSGFGKSAGGETGRSSYRKASAKWHPDKWINASIAAHAEAAKKFLAVQQAYEGTLQ